MNLQDERLVFLIFIGAIPALLIPPLLLGNWIWFFLSFVASSWLIIAYMGWREQRNRK